MNPKLRIPLIIPLVYLFICFSCKPTEKIIVPVSSVDISARGLLLDAGVLWPPGRFRVGLGATLTSFRIPSGVVSVGVSF